MHNMGMAKKGGTTYELYARVKLFCKRAAAQRILYKQLRLFQRD
jgi:hypothetical protein